MTCTEEDYAQFLELAREKGYPLPKNRAEEAKVRQVISREKAKDPSFRASNTRNKYVERTVEEEELAHLRRMKHIERMQAQEERAKERSAGSFEEYAAQVTKQQMGGGGGKAKAKAKKGKGKKKK